MEDLKICSTCRIPQPITNFNKCKKEKSGLQYRCKSCRVKYNKKYHESNLEKNKINTKKWRENNPNYNKEYGKKWRENNPDYDKNYKKEYYSKPENLDKIKKLGEKYRKNQDNIEKANERSRKWNNDNPEKAKIQGKKQRENPDYKEKRKKYDETYYHKNPPIKAWRGVLQNCLTRMDKEKEGHTIDLLGYSAIEFKNHMIPLFTEGMSWGNHGEWHIDHIKRVCEFDKDTHPSIVNALSNLRPLWATSRTINGIFYEGNLNRVKY